MLNPKVNARPGIAGLDFIAVIIGSVIGATIGAAAVLVIQIVRIAASGAAKIGMSAFSKAKSPTEKRSAENVTLNSVEVIDKIKPDLQKHKAVFAPELEKQYLDSFCRQVKVKGGHVNVWFYPNQGIARRSLVITQAGLIKKLGRRIALPDVKVELPHGVPEVLEKTSEDASAIVSTTTKVSVTKIQSEKAVLPDSNSVVVADNERKEEPPLPTIVSTPARPRKKEAVYQGVLMKYGVELRDDGKDPYPTPPPRRIVSVAC